MLILSRRPGESITIGDDITVTIVASAAARSDSASPRRAKCGCCGEEIYQAIQEENRAAANVPDSGGN